MPNDAQHLQQALHDLEGAITKELIRTFDSISKVAMRASAELSDPNNNDGIATKVQNAHSVIRLIVDDALRVLGSMGALLVGVGVTAALHGEAERRSGTDD